MNSETRDTPSITESVHQTSGTRVISPIGVSPRPEDLPDRRVNGFRRLTYYLLTFAVVAASIASFIFFEGWIVALALFFGFLGASLILSATFIILTLAVIYLYDYGQREQEYKLVTKLKAWLAKQEQKIKPWTKNLVKKNLPLGFLVFTEIFGPVITIIIIKATTDTEKRRLRILAVISSFVFSFTWVAIYSGAIYGIKKLF